MQAGKRIILLEFNELCPDLLTEWMAAGKLPNFKRFHDASRACIAHADVDDPELLEPWIQWYSMHTGLSYPQHGVLHLTDGPRAGHTDIWHALAEQGFTVGNCAGMNAGRVEGPGSFYLPDPWCSTEAPFPAELEAYQRVVLSQVQENSNKAAKLDGPAMLRFLRFVAGHGLRPSSVQAILRQLTTDMRSKGERWKRAALLDRLQADVFLHYWRRLKPDFASFFINSTAHFQHAYFHLLRPESFDLPAERFDDADHQDAILFGYQQMDRLLADMFALEDQGAMLVLATALSQHPNPQAGWNYYRPRDMQGLLDRIGLQAGRVLPVMAHQYSLEFPSEAATEAARTQLGALRWGDQPAFSFNDSPPLTLYTGSTIHDDVPADAQITLPGGGTIGFHETFYRIPHTKSGAHHPDSVLWFKTGQHSVEREKVSILDVFPTLLDYYGADPARVPGPVRAGRSLVDELGLARQHRAPTVAMAAE
jgi:hypothetical protein